MPTTARTFALLNILLVSLLVTGCIDQVQVADEESMATRIKMVKASQEALISIAIASKTATSWEEAHKAVNNIVTNALPALREDLAPRAAQTLMTDWLLTGEATPKKQSALASQTELLLQQSTLHDVVVLAQALERLTGHWSAEQLSEAAADALTKMEAHQIRSHELLKQLPANLKDKMQGDAANRTHAIESLELIRN